MPQADVRQPSVGEGTQTVSAAELQATLKQIAAAGLSLGEPREITIAKMVTYLKSVRANLPPSGPNSANSIASLVYSAVKLTPSGWDTWLAGFRFPGEDAIGSVADFLKLLVRAETWVRVGLFAGGGILVFMGLKQMAKVFDVTLPSIPGVPIKP